MTQFQWPLVIGTHFQLQFRNNVKPNLSLQTKVDSKHYEEVMNVICAAFTKA